MGVRLPVEELPVETLEWQLDLPWWRDGDRFSALRPRQVLASPERYAEQYERTLTADLAFPLAVTLHSGPWVVLDGLHRLLKAVLLGLSTVPTQRLLPAVVPRIAADAQTAESAHNRHASGTDTSRFPR